MARLRAGDECRCSLAAELVAPTTARWHGWVGVQNIHG
jgi:hypothetical protein